MLRKMWKQWVRERPRNSKKMRRYPVHFHRLLRRILRQIWRQQNGEQPRNKEVMRRYPVLSPIVSSNASKNVNVMGWRATEEQQCESNEMESDRAARQWGYTRFMPDWVGSLSWVHFQTFAYSCSGKLYQRLCAFPLATFGADGCSFEGWVSRYQSEGDTLIFHRPVQVLNAFHY